jgi:hypothetical protein
MLGAAAAARWASSALIATGQSENMSVIGGKSGIDRVPRKERKLRWQIIKGSSIGLSPFARLMCGFSVSLLFAIVTRLVGREGDARV